MLLFVSQEQRIVEGTDRLWNIPYKYSVSDPDNKLAKVLKELELNNPVVTGEGGDEGYTTGLFASYAKSRGYTNGMVQPSLLVLTDDMKVLFRWSINPSLMNGFGVSDRPNLKQIMELIKDKASGKVAMDEARTLEELRLLRKVKVMKLYDPGVLCLLLKKLLCCCFPKEHRA